MRTRMPACALLLAALLALPHGAALHCNGDIIAISAGGETLYMDDRSTAPGEIDHWLYLESNDMPGLQSGGDDLWLGQGPISYTDACAHPDPDSLIV